MVSPVLNDLPRIYLFLKALHHSIYVFTSTFTALSKVVKIVVFDKLVENIRSGLRDIRLFISSAIKVSLSLRMTRFYRLIAKNPRSLYYSSFFVFDLLSIYVYMFINISKMKLIILNVCFSNEYKLQCET